MLVELGEPVILRVDPDGELDADILHLPAAFKRVGSRHGKRRVEWESLERTCPGLTLWPGLCGLNGWVYVYGGVVRERVLTRQARWCSVCLPREHLRAPRPEACSPLRQRRRPRAASGSTFSAVN